MFPRWFTKRPEEPDRSKPWCSECKTDRHMVKIEDRSFYFRYANLVAALRGFYECVAPFSMCASATGSPTKHVCGGCGKTYQ